MPTRFFAFFLSLLYPWILFFVSIIEIWLNDLSGYLFCKICEICLWFPKQLLFLNVGQSLYKEDTAVYYSKGKETMLKSASERFRDDFLKDFQISTKIVLPWIMVEFISAKMQLVNLLLPYLESKCSSKLYNCTLQLCFCRYKFSYVPDWGYYMTEPSLMLLSQSILL